MALGIVAQQDNRQAAQLAEGIQSAFDDRGIPVHIDEVTGAALSVQGEPVDELSRCDLVVSIGGDGTFLFTARAVGDTPIVGVNLGEVGFLNAVAPNEAIEVITDLYPDAAGGSVSTQTLPRLRATGTEWSIGPALNEIIVHAPRRGPSRSMDVTIRIDGTEFTQDVVDGVMVATPTGSTAYNLSEGGPLLDPRVTGFAVTEMCGRDEYPSVVVPLDARIEIEVTAPTAGFGIADGRTRQKLEGPTTVLIERAETPVRIAGPRLEFYDALEKLE